MRHFSLFLLFLTLFGPTFADKSLPHYHNQQHPQPPGSAADGNGVVFPDENEETRSLADTVMQLINTEQKLTLFSAMIQNIEGFEEELREESDSFTIFAPSNDAFTQFTEANLLSVAADPDAVEAIVSRHISRGRKLQSSDFDEGSSLLSTIAGEYLTVTAAKGDLTVTSSLGESEVIRANLNADNGVVHIIDKVL